VHAVDSTGDVWGSYDIITQPAFAFVSEDGSVDTFNGGLGEDALVDRINTLIGT
jgi:hypothetical protein